MSTLNILALSGSLRTASTNTALIRAASELAPEGVSIQLYDYSGLPFYNSDVDLPEAVSEFKQAIADSHGVLIATPEYNYSVPGVLKNAIDWASRPAYESVFRDKPTGVISAAASFVGGARAQQHLKTILLGMGTPVFAWPELLVGTAHKKFDGGKLVDETTAGMLSDYVAGFTAWVRSAATTAATP